MLRWAVAIAEARRGRRAAVTMIGPLVERSRAALNGIPDIAWRDPYLVGFMLTLITIVARIESRALQDDDLSLVQSQAWQAITGMDADLIGEDALTLSDSGTSALGRSETAASANADVAANVCIRAR